MHKFGGKSNEFQINRLHLNCFMNFLQTFLILTLLPLTSVAQIYYMETNDIEVTKENEKIEDPFTGGFNNAQFSGIDLNQDGIMDLVITDRFFNAVIPYINAGIADSIHYTYAPEYIDKFPPMNQVLVTRDYNDDGKMDLFVCGNSIDLYENISTINGGLSFQLVDKLQTKYNPSSSFIGVLNPNAINYPAIEDIDGDKDIDIISRSTSRTLDYHRNLSIDNNNNFNTLYERRSPCWGYISFTFDSNFTLDSILLNDCNRLTRGERLKHSEGVSTTAIDLDQNGSMDLITSDIGTYQMKVLLNADSLPGAKTNSEIFQVLDSFPNYDTPISMLYSTAYFLDVNNDGLEDLIASSSHANNSALGPYAKEEVWLYENVSATGGYRFQLKTKSFLKNNTLDFGRNAKPVFIDHNKDGLKDLLIGNGGYLSENDSNIFIESLALLENTGTAVAPRFDVVSTDYLSIANLDFGIVKALFANASPAVGDVDGDGDEDFLLCQRNGEIFYFEDTAATGSEAAFKFHPEPFQGIKDIANIQAIQLYDIDRDGLLDLVTNFSTKISFFPNFGSATNSIFNIQLDSVIWQNGNTFKYFISEDINYSKIKVGDSLAIDNASNQNNNLAIALVVSSIDSINSSIECINTLPSGVVDASFNEVNSNATMNFYRRDWKINRNGGIGRFENVFLFEDQGETQFYAGGENNTTYRVNSFIESLAPIYSNANTEKVFMSNFGYNMFLNGTDLNGDGIMDLAVGISTGGIKILYGSRVNSIDELSNSENETPSIFKIYPNPSKGEVNIEFLKENSTEKYIIEIQNVSGQLILRREFSVVKRQLKIGDLPQGIYFITILSGSNKQTEKLIVQP